MDQGGYPLGTGPRLVPFLYLPTALLCVHLGPLVATRRPPEATLPRQQLLFEIGLSFRLVRGPECPHPRPFLPLRASRVRPMVGRGLWGQHRSGSGDP